jgi:hypothetical protein
MNKASKYETIRNSLDKKNGPTISNSEKRKRDEDDSQSKEEVVTRSEFETKLMRIEELLDNKVRKVYVTHSNPWNLWPQ